MAIVGYFITYPPPFLLNLAIKKDAAASFFIRLSDYGANEDPQPQVFDTFGFLITNCAPLRSSR